MIKLKIITAKTLFFEGETKLLNMQTDNGDIGVYENHVPLVSRITYGQIYFNYKNEKKKYMVINGIFASNRHQGLIIAANVYDLKQEQNHWKQTALNYYETLKEQKLSKRREIQNKIIINRLKKEINQDK